jgi:hypothetical protein
MSIILVTAKTDTKDVVAGFVRYSSAPASRPKRGRGVVDGVAVGGGAGDPTAACGAGPAARPDTAHRRAYDPARGRSGMGARIAAFHQGLQEWPQRVNRLPLGPGRCRPLSEVRGGVDRARTGCHSGKWRLGRGSVAAGDPDRADSFAGVADPVGAGFVDSLARPGGNATGFMSFEFSTSGKWLELLKQMAPRMTRAAVLRDPIGTATRQFAAIQTVAQSLKVEVNPVNLRDDPPVGHPCGERRDLFAAIRPRQGFRADRPLVAEPADDHRQEDVAPARSSAPLRPSRALRMAVWS